MNYKELAKCAYRQETPHVLDLLCEARTKVNPVAVATKLCRNDELRWIFHAIFVPPFVLSIIFGGINFMAGTWEISAAIALVTGVLSCIGWIISQSGRHYFLWVSNTGKSLVVRYGNDLDLYVKWAGPPVKRHRVDEPTHRKTAIAILRAKACEVVRSRRLAERVRNPMLELAHKLDEGKLFTEFKTMITVLNRLGIADLKRKPIFDEAEKVVDTEEKQQREGAAAAQQLGLPPVPELEPPMPSGWDI